MGESRYVRILSISSSENTIKVSWASTTLSVSQDGSTNISAIVWVGSELLSSVNLGR